jgi:hypothetical protein
MENPREIRYPFYAFITNLHITCNNLYGTSQRELLSQGQGQQEVGCSNIPALSSLKELPPPEALKEI